MFTPTKMAEDENNKKDRFLPASPRTNNGPNPNFGDERQRYVTNKQGNNVSSNFGVGASILLSAIIIAGAWVYTTGLKVPSASPEASVIANKGGTANYSVVEEEVLPAEGVILPVRWGDLGAQMISAGVIDRQKFEEVYASRGGLSEGEKSLLYSEDNGDLMVTSDNAGYVLNLLWALGMGNKNEVLENGPMTDSRYGGAENFASTGGWTLAMGDTMNHYSRHPFVVLTKEQQLLVERVSKNIYRPCCNNATYFPDCNHGMAMLGLLELMASQGVSEEEMYRVALQVNAYWFPENYMTIAKFLAARGVAWESADPKEILGANYSSGSGYREILSQTTPPAQKNSGSCGV